MASRLPLHINAVHGSELRVDGCLLRVVGFDA
jgi:hypothetical protein